MVAKITCKIDANIIYPSKNVAIAELHSPVNDKHSSTQNKMFSPNRHRADHRQKSNSATMRFRFVVIVILCRYYRYGTIGDGALVTERVVWRKTTSASVTISSPASFNAMYMYELLLGFRTQKKTCGPN